MRHIAKVRYVDEQNRSHYIEIDSDVADGKHSVILQQESHGIAIRMAIMSMVMGQVNKNENKEKKK